MHVKAGCGVALGLVAVLTLGCSENSGGPGVTAEEFEPPASDCEVPEPPAVAGEALVVGNGAPDSCTEQALREALEQGGDIRFDCGSESVTIPIEQELSVPVDANLHGGGLVTLDGGGETRILHSAARVELTVQGLGFVRGHAIPTDDVLGSGGAIRVGWLGQLSVFDCSFSDNVASDEGIEGGGAIYQSNGGSLLVVNSSFSGNRAVSGGAIDNLLSPMKLVGSTFVDNESQTGGGAVYDDGASEKIDDDIGGDIDICGCRFENNQTVGQGGAVYLWAYPGDRFLINQTSFEGNRVTRPSDGSALGGALRTGNAPLQLANSTFIGNHADVHGGAYWTDGEAPVTILNSTFYHNDAGVDGEEGGYGGAISGFNIALSHVTMIGNTAVFSGGAVSNEKDSWSMSNSVVAFNTADNPWNQGQNCTNTMPGSHNLQWPEPGEGDSLCTEEPLFADPKLAEPADNGGATLTMQPAEDSPVLDAGADCAPTDQRGEPRGEPCDLGAFEAP